MDSHRGTTALVRWMFTLKANAYILARTPKLLTEVT
jgi:hypothetical protein